MHRRWNIPMIRRRWEGEMKQSRETSGGLVGMEAVLHDLCQPLTILQCKLELGLLKGDQEAAHAAMTDGLRECTRLTAAVNAMRDLMRRMKLEDCNHGGGEGTF
jgi:hypothetical protein